MDESPRPIRAYKPRLVDGILKQKLRISGAVLIEGPKWCGKTTTSENVAESVLRLGEPESLKHAKLLALNDISSLLNGASPRLVDEWQEIPELWDTARSEVDRRRKFGQFIFTGSAVLPKEKRDKIIHSGTGRFSRIKMRTMSLFESGDSNGEVCLRDLFKKRVISGENPLSVKDLGYVTCRGGFPQSLAIKSKRDALLVAREYYKSIIESDISRADSIKRNPIYVERFMRSYARLQGEQSPLTVIQQDMGSVTGEAPNINTVVSYFEALKSIFVIDDVPAWNPNLRSKTAIRVTDTRYYVDPSIATIGLDVDAEGLLLDENTFGFVFETLCMRDLRVYAESLGGDVSHYLDSNGLECDAVIHLPGGKYGLVQIKLGGDDEQIEDAASKMKSLKNQLNPERTPLPAFMMVLTGIQKNAYRREDGVYVVPVGCLKP